MELLGWVANLLFFGGGLVRSPRHTMAFYFVADILYIIMYLTSGMFNAAISMIVTGIRCLLAIILPERYNLYSVVILTTLSSVLILSNLKEVADILIVFAGIAIGFSCYARDHFILYRSFTSLSQILWIAHSLIFGVYPMIFCCVMILATNIYALIRHTTIEDWSFIRFRRVPSISS